MQRTTKTKPVTPENMRKMAMDIMDYLYKVDMFEDVIILVDNEFWRSNIWLGENAYKKMTTKKGTPYLCRENYDIASHDEHVNPETVTIIIDGSPISKEINGWISGYDKWVYRVFNKKFAYKYGLHFEMPHCWMLTAHKNM